jgi:hypothetical protein
MTLPLAIIFRLYWASLLHWFAFRNSQPCNVQVPAICPASLVIDPKSGNSDSGKISSRLKFMARGFCTG